MLANKLLHKTPFVGDKLGAILYITLILKTISLAKK